MHFQLFTQRYYDTFWPKLEDMDGYERNDVASNPDIVDPTMLVMEAA